MPGHADSEEEWSGRVEESNDDEEHGAERRKGWVLYARRVCVCVCARNKTVKDSFTRASAADRPELWLPEQFFIIIVQQTKGKRKKDCVQHLIYNTRGTSFAICSSCVCVLEAPDKQFVMSTRGAPALTGCWLSYLNRRTTEDKLRLITSLSPWVIICANGRLIRREIGFN